MPRYQTWVTTTSTVPLPVCHCSNNLQFVLHPILHFFFSLRLRLILLALRKVGDHNHTFYIVAFSVAKTCKNIVFPQTCEDFEPSTAPLNGIFNILNCPFFADLPAFCHHLHNEGKTHSKCEFSVYMHKKCAGKENYLKTPSVFVGLAPFRTDILTFGGIFVFNSNVPVNFIVLTFSSKRGMSNLPSAWLRPPARDLGFISSGVAVQSSCGSVLFHSLFKSQQGSSTEHLRVSTVYCVA